MLISFAAGLGRHPFEAHRAALTFQNHDERLIRKSAAHAGDDAAIIDIARKGRAEIANVLGSDIRDSDMPHDHAWEAPDKTREWRPFKSPPLPGYMAPCNRAISTTSRSIPVTSTS